MAVTFLTNEDREKLDGDISQLSEEINNVVDDITTSEVIGTKDVDVFPVDGFGFTVGGDGYSRYIDIHGGKTYRLGFTECTYNGTGVAVELAIECYDADKNVVADGASVGSDRFAFVSWASGNMCGTPLVTGSYPSGGYKDINFLENVCYMRFIINNVTSAVINDRMPIGWTLIHQDDVMKYIVKLPQVMASKNLFVKEKSTTGKDVYLGKKSDGTALYGWYLSSIGSAEHSVSGSGIDSTSHAIPVVGGESYLKIKGTTFNIFDADDVWIASVGMSETICAIPANGAFVRIGFASAKRNEMQFVEGDKEVAYDPGAYQIPLYASAQHPQLNKMLNRGALSWDFSSDYLRDIADEANKYVAPDRASFIFVTDTHCHENNTYVGSIVAEMSRYVPVSCIVHGGDIIDGLSAPAGELRTLSEFVRNLTCARVPTLYCKGNHDDNCSYARLNGKLADLYIKNMELFNRTNAFCEERVARAGDDKMYAYVDDNRTKVRTIIMNAFDVSETVGEDGTREEDSRTNTQSLEQMQWLASTALNFMDKNDRAEWGVIIAAHQPPTTTVNGILSAFKSGVNFNYNEIVGNFAEQGALEFISFFIGDDHYDALGSAVYGNNTFCRIKTLNASLAQDNISSAATDNSILYPPVKTFGTSNETAFDLVTIDRSNKHIYLTRYGAVSNVYNESTGAFDIPAARTRIVDYTTSTYVKLTD